MIHGSVFIHPKAHVEDSDIGEGSKVWQFASVVRKARLGKNCTVAAGAMIDGAWFGDNCIISSCCAIGPGFYVSNNVFIGPSVTFCNDRFPATHKKDFYPELLRDEFIVIKVKDGAAIGANSVLLPGIVIGRMAMIAAGSAVNINVPDNHLFRRDGTIVPIKEKWREDRMKEASCLL